MDFYVIFYTVLLLWPFGLPRGFY